MKTKQPKTIPTILGIIILVVSIIFGVFLIRKNQALSLKAAAEIAPKEVKITNLSDTSFTVSWLTQTAADGFVSFGENSPDQAVPDDRDKGVGSKSSKFTHYVTLDNLKPSTKYYFKINSGGKFFDRGGNLYEVTTAPTINLALPSADTAFGIVIDSNENPAKGAIVYLSLANTAPLSSLVSNDGSWVIPLSMARTMSLSSYSKYDQEIQIEEIFVQGGNLGTSTAIAITKYDSPVPSLTLGQNYDFRQNIPTIFPTDSPSLESGFFTGLTPVISTTITPSQSGSGFSLDLLASPSPTESKLTILNPDEGENINTTQPEFIGTAPGGNILEINVESEITFSGEVLVDEDGNWQWTPPSNLPPGEHTITVTLRDKNGLTQKIIRNFTVYATGNSNLPSFVATSSATIQPTSPPSPTVVPTLAPTLIPGLTVEPTRFVATPTEKPVQPRTGNLTTTLAFFTIGLVMLFFGLKQFGWNQ